MEKEFIPYEQALALKKLGFDEPCFTKFEDYFDKTKLQPIIATLCLNGPYENEYHGYDQKIINDDVKRWFFTGYKNSVKNHNQNILSAPTYQQAFRWFREKYNKIVYLYPYFENQYQELKDLKPDGYRYIIFPYGKSRMYETYEEAELECLKKLIEIVKNK